MADNDKHDTHLLHTSIPLLSLPLNLSGFTSGNTIQLQGDTENLQFSVQFNITPKPTSKINETSSPNSSSSSYVTPISISTHEEEDQNWNREDHSHNAIFDHWISHNEDYCNGTEKEPILTRLRSGVLSPVKYFPRNLSFGSKKRGRKEDVLKRVLRRHRFPVRPCSSYAFFVMTTWDVAKSSSFGETSKRLGEMWSKLPLEEKKVFEDMALKDNTRYKRQCMLLKSIDQEGDGLGDSKTLDFWTG